MAQFGPVAKSMDDEVAVFLAVMAAAFRGHPTTLMASRVTCNNNDSGMSHRLAHHAKLVLTALCDQKVPCLLIPQVSTSFEAGFSKTV